jgi:probable HAF family extracellular repeat protein
MKTLFALLVGATAAYGGTFVYSFLDFPALGPNGVTSLCGINAQGDILGNAYVMGGPPDSFFSFVYSNGVFSEVGPPGFNAEGFNDRRQVVGELWTGPIFSSVVMTTGGVVQQVIAYPGAQQTQATAINDADTVVGIYSDVGGNYHAFQYTGGLYQDLGITLQSYATGINNNGVIAGYYQPSGFVTHSFLYNNGFFTTVDGAPFDSAFEGINDLGQIVGDNFFYENGVFTDLPAAGGWQAQVRSINNSGEMVGHAGFEGLIINATPAPSTISIIPVGLLCIWVRSMRARQSTGLKSGS